MPSILFGDVATARRVERGEFFCPECQAQRSYQRTVVRRSLTLLRVPLLPAGRYGEFVECAHCRSTYRPEVLAYDARDGEPPPLPEYQRTIRRVLALMVVTDGRIHGKEVETVQAVYEAVTGHRLDQAEVLDEIVEVRAHPVSVARVLARAMGHLNDYGKEQVLRACALISRSDDEVHAREVQMIEHLARVMRLDPSRTREILGELT